jgi:LuxR family maltose regulon positive regulatory protein
MKTAITGATGFLGKRVAEKLRKKGENLALTSLSMGVDLRDYHQALAFLLDHLPPQFHLVIASRTVPPLPLSRLRARGQLTELRAADLRFTSAEIAEFLNTIMGLGLSAGDVAALEARTEGWIAGLQLAALSLQEQTNRSEFIKAFTGDDRYILDYLLDEVFSRQPESVQNFLLQTSILDRLCGSLCDAVLSRGAGEIGSRGEFLNLSPAPLLPCSFLSRCWNT